MGIYCDGKRLACPANLALRAIIGEALYTESGTPHIYQTSNFPTYFETKIQSSYLTGWHLVTADFDVASKAEMCLTFLTGTIIPVQKVKK